MNFAEHANILCGHVCLALGWRPHEFWDATPAELLAITAALSPHDALPPDAQSITRLMELYPDG